MAGTPITVTLPAAEDDLLRILDYLEGDNPSAILKVVDALGDAIGGETNTSLRKEIA